MTQPMTKLAHHIDQGAVTMYTVDADSAVSQHPEEWSLTPWKPEDAKAARAAREQRYKEELDRHKTVAEQAKTAGLPVPPPPTPPAPPPAPLTDAQKASLDADAKARQEAADRVRVRAEQDEKKRIEDEQIAADKALLASSPPVPDPNERRPFGRPGPMTPAERAQADKRNAAKAEADAKAKKDAALAGSGEV